MTYQFKISFNEAHAKYAVRRFFVRFMGVDTLVAFLVLAIVVLYLFLWEEADWIFGALWVGLGLGIVLFASAYFLRVNRAVSRIRELKDPTVCYELTDERFKATSDLGTSELKWEAFKALWMSPKVWLLMFDKWEFLTLPTDQVPAEAQDFLKQKIAAAGGKIK